MTKNAIRKALRRLVDSLDVRIIVEPGQPLRYGLTEIGLNRLAWIEASRRVPNIHPDWMKMLKGGKFPKNMGNAIAHA